MKSLGQVIREWRKQAGWTQTELAAHTNIWLEYIQSLEADRTDHLPAAVYVQGYLQLIAQACHQNEETILALYRRDLEPLLAAPSQPAPIPSRRSRGWLSALWRWSPRQRSIAIFVVIVVGAAGLLTWQWRLLTRPPHLVITQPTNYATVASPLTISGQTDRGSTVTLNTEALSVNNDGFFTTTLSLPPGDRTLVFQATDNHGRHSRTIVFITVE